MIVCQNCHTQTADSSNFCPACGFQYQQVRLQGQGPQFLSIYPDGVIDVRALDVREARIALKELRVLRKEIAAEKRQIMEQKRQIRANYTDRVRQSRILLDFKFLRDGDRRNLAVNLVPLENKQRLIEHRLLKVDQAIAATEGFILRNS